MATGSMIQAVKVDAQYDGVEDAISKVRVPGRVKVSPTLAKMLVELDDIGGAEIFVIRTPMAGTEYAAEIRGEKNIYGVKMVEGIGVTPDEELAKRICAELPSYTYSRA